MYWGLRGGWASRPLMTVMPEHPFVTGEARLTIARPIIGPPLMTLPASAGSPPAASIRPLDGRTQYTGCRFWP